MHFEILVEDMSGRILLESVMQIILNPEEHSYKIHPYKGIGRIPRNLRGMTDPRKRILLDRLPAILQGYGKTYQHVDNVVVIVVVDLDRKNCVEFKSELLDVLDNCNPKPLTLFRIAIEECEAWLMGDRQAIKSAYPGVNELILDSYSQDSICGTWEMLADAVYPGGSKKIMKLGYPEIGKIKCEWAERISPNMDIENNRSKSFQVFRDGIRKFL